MKVTGLGKHSEYEMRMWDVVGGSGSHRLALAVSGPWPFLSGSFSAVCFQAALS